jgi:hypothetical protein
LLQHRRQNRELELRFLSIFKQVSKKRFERGLGVERIKERDEVAQILSVILVRNFNCQTRYELLLLVKETVHETFLLGEHQNQVERDLV